MIKVSRPERTSTLLGTSAEYRSFDRCLGGLGTPRSDEPPSQEKRHGRVWKRVADNS
jgi:hypothetical protein